MARDNSSSTNVFKAYNPYCIAFSGLISLYLIIESFSDFKSTFSRLIDDLS